CLTALHLSSLFPYSTLFRSFMAQVENLSVEPDNTARVVIDETSGVIVMGENVRVSTVAIAQGNLTITVTEAPAVSQPAPFSRGQDRKSTRLNSSHVKISYAV